MATQYSFGKIVTDGLVLCLDAADRNSYVSGSTTWMDIAGSNNSTLVNGPTFNTGSGGSIVFDGVNDYVSIPGTLPLNNINKFTYNSFLTFNNKGGVYGNGFFSYGTTNNYPYDIFFFWNSPTADLQFQINNGADGAAIYTFAPPSGFINLCVVYDGSQSTNDTKLKVYINSIQITLNFNTFTVPSTTATLSNPTCLIGDYACTPGYYTLTGKVAITQIYNRALSTSEVLQNYNAQKSRYNL
jgi:hypothetical protein